MLKPISSTVVAVAAATLALGASSLTTSSAHAALWPCNSYFVSGGTAYYNNCTSDNHTVMVNYANGSTKWRCLPKNRLSSLGRAGNQGNDVTYAARTGTC